jgi:hypothetical protein
MTRYGSKKEAQYIDVDVVAGGSDSAPYAATTSVSGGSSQGIKPDKKGRRGGWGHIALAPVKGIAKACMWFVTPTRSGGAQYVMYALTFGCFMLSVENVYVGMNRKDPAGHRFIPKLGLVEDGSEIARLLPFPGVLDSMQNAVLGAVNFSMQAIAPGTKPFRDNYNPKLDLIVWADPNFYAAIVGAGVLSALQAIALRQVSLEVRKTQLQKAQKKDESIAAATSQSSYQQRKRLETRVIETQVKQHGNGKVLMFGALVALSYVAEFLMFAMSAKPGTPFFQSLILAIASTVGTETSYTLARDFEERPDHD